MNLRAIFFCNTTVLLIGSLLGPSPAEAGFTTFTDRAAFLAAVGPSVSDDSYDSYATGDIGNDSTLGDFQYSYGADVQPAVVPGAYGGNALGGSPFDVFVGGNSVKLTSSSSMLQAFGADFYYGEWAGDVPSDVYRLRVEDGSGAGTLVGNPGGLNMFGGAFFLGVLAEPGSEFAAVSLLSVVPTDQDGNPSVLVAAYQIDSLAYDTAAQAVPDQSSSLILLMTGGSALWVGRRRWAR